MSALHAAVLAAVAVVLAMPGSPRPRVAATSRASRRRPLVVLPWVALTACSGVAAAGVVPLRLLALGCVAGGVVVAARLLWTRLEQRRQREQAARHVLSACELIAAELGAGQPPGAALAAAAREWPGLAPVADAFVLGSDVPDALRDLAARHPGADDLRLVAAAWQVAHHSGHGLAAAVDRVAGRIRSVRATRRVVESELASARSTARLVAALPLAALLLGSGAGGSPWEFLLGTPAGLACLAAGLALGCLGLWWIEALADGVERA
ncbi:type II secretion system protein [Nocardioides gansuensis]|uniref:Type II secretion system protein n=1 Tax=Nocardioides gansuensis TaxID=2138300 RepID=A0A2T8F9S2_9ACTN|nr:type II secretion system F family protein [Nocardioides gansuensis]PVG82417.1 type II secretion system protein [Nocardioides gansuensis]